MKKYFLIKQPPLSDKFIFLVDDINETKTFGVTKDFDKIEYNLKLMGEEFNQELEIGINFNETGITEVIDLGRYISVVAIRKDRKEGVIYFFDSTSNFTRNEFLQQIKLLFNSNIAEKFIEIYDFMMSSSEKLDCVELLLPDLES